VAALVAVVDATVPRGADAGACPRDGAGWRQGARCRPSDRGVVRSRPNVFGGFDWDLPGGRRASSRPNVFGGRDVVLPDGTRIVCRPNVFGGEDCR